MQKKIAKLEHKSTPEADGNTIVFLVLESHDDQMWIIVLQ